MSRTSALSHKILNWPEYNKAQKRRGSLTVWFDRDMTWAVKPTGKRGRHTTTEAASKRKSIV